MRLKNKNAIVTGAAGYFGQAIVETFFREGAQKIALIDIKEEQLKVVEKKFKLKGYQAFAYQADVSNEIEVKNIINQILNNFKTIDILVNNAGIAQDMPIQKVSVQDWERGISVNLKSVFLFSKNLIDTMIDRKYGKIINISSVAGQMGRPVSVEYAASKAGIIGLTRNMAYRLASFGININAVAPGPVGKPMLGKRLTKEVVNRQKSILFKRKGTPEDIANAVLFLASDEAGWITGQVLNVNGGLFMG